MKQKDRLRNLGEVLGIGCHLKVYIGKKVKTEYILLCEQAQCAYSKHGPEGCVTLEKKIMIRDIEILAALGYNLTVKYYKE